MIRGFLSISVHVCMLLVSLTISGSMGCGRECSSADSTINATDYTQDCTTDTDCVAEPAGDMCNAACTNCLGAAINVRDRNRYETDLADKIGKEVICPCPYAEAKCVAALCVLAGP